MRSIVECLATAHRHPHGWLKDCVDQPQSRHRPAVASENRGFAGNAVAATVRVRNLADLDKLKCEALQPGIESPVPVKSTVKAGVLELNVPLVRGCAMVKIAKGG